MSRPSERHDAELDVRFGRAWRDHHRYVLDVAFRMLGNLPEAEDVVQEAYTRLLRVDIDEIVEVRGWLVVVVSRLCLDRMRSQRRHPATPTSSFDDDAAPGTRPGDGTGGRQVDPADRVTLDDSVRLALHLVLERLSPAERTAFVLHDVFQFSFEEVGEIVGRTPAACRQLASRARQRIHSETGGPARFAVEPAAQNLVTERFIAATSSGDLQGLLAVLDPDVDGDVDLGAGPFSRPVVNPDIVARTILHYFGPETGNTLLSLPTAGDGGAVGVFYDEHLMATISLDFKGNLVNEIHVLLDPAKLAPIHQAFTEP